MKLRNKKTGEIIELLAKPSFVKRNDDYLQSEVNTFNSLAELNKEWEDYEEPNEYWYIYGNQVLKNECDGVMEDSFKEIGNYFETREEAEKAVEKLKAWKRLKDKGIRFYGWRRNQTGTIDLLVSWEGVPPLTGFIEEDLDLLFGGEE